MGSDTAQTETRTFQAEIGKLLDLMIDSLYSNKEIFLRELISNASDACDKLRYAAIAAPELLEGDPDLAVTVSVDREKRLVRVADNGIGMNRDELVEISAPSRGRAPRRSSPGWAMAKRPTRA